MTHNGLLQFFETQCTFVSSVTKNGNTSEQQQNWNGNSFLLCISSLTYRKQFL